jgi:NAD(P)-dependent dehydrogenase (short-subunit alcohol dehydrogenase family)
MRRLESRVAIVTGAGRGIGRAHALALAAGGASVVVNDLGGDREGNGVSETPAHDVVREIGQAGGRAIVSNHDVADWRQAEELVGLATRSFGGLHVLVNNAGILRDRTLANLEEGEWDAVIRVHLKGHAAMARHCMAYWRLQSKAGKPPSASMIHTTSIAGFAGNFGQAAYAAAKAGIIGLSLVAALEGRSYGVRSNAVSPSARTRLDPSMKAAAEGAFDTFDPGNVSPLVAWLAEAGCPATGQVFQAYGNRIKVISPATIAEDLRTDGRWDVATIDRELHGRLLDARPLSYYVEEIGAVG